MQQIGIVEFRLAEALFEPELQELVVAQGTINEVVSRIPKVLLQGGCHGG